MTILRELIGNIEDDGEKLEKGEAFKNSVKYRYCVMYENVKRLHVFA